MFCEYCSSCVKCGDVVSESVATCKFNVNSGLQKISREPSSLAISTEASLDNDSNKEVLNVNNVLSAIIEQKCIQCESTQTFKNIHISELPDTKNIRKLF